MDRLQVAIETGGHALLEGLADTLITEQAESVRLTHPTHVQRARQLAARLRSTGAGACGYAYPLVRSGTSWIPIAYTTVKLEPAGAEGILVRRTGDDLQVNRRYLKHDAELADGEIAEFIAALKRRERRDFPATLAQFLNPEDVAFHALLFPLEPDSITSGLTKDLKWIGRQTTDRLSGALKAYLGLIPPPHTPPQVQPDFLTAVRSNPAQNEVLRRRDQPLQVVTGPPGTGKTQTIINLIAAAVADGRSVLFVSKNNKAVDNVHDAFRDLDLFPGLLRLGHRERRQEALRQARRWLAREPLPTPVRLEDLRQESARLAAGLSDLEAGILRTERAEAELREATQLQQQTEEALRPLPVYGWARERAGRITDTTEAALLTTEQMAGLRYASALVAGWEGEPAGLDRLLELVGLLSPIRLRRLRRLIERLRLPPSLQLEAANLNRLTGELLSAQLSYPFLFATARRILAEAKLQAGRPLAALKADRDQIAQQKLTHDRRLLQALWQIRLGRARQTLTEIDQALETEEQMSGGAMVSKEVWTRRASQFRAILGLFPVICCTNLSLSGSVPNERELFDLVILDEASQSDIASLLPALYRGSRVCIVGDEQQLRHISSIDPAADIALMAQLGLSGLAGFRYSDHSAFDRACAAAGRANVRLLDRHYRCVPEIIGFCNQEFYGGRLRVERETLPEMAADLPQHGFRLDDVSTGAVAYRSTRSGASATNEAEARRVVWLARQYAERGFSSIGVVTPFRGQRLLISQMLRDAADEIPAAQVRNALLAVEVGTIHTFQGGQKRMMLFSTVVAPGARSGTVEWFGQNRHLVNVAISRAEDLLILVGHRSTLLEAGGILQQMAEYAGGVSGSRGAVTALPPGLQPARFGLRHDERDVLAEWLTPGAVLAVLNPGERELFGRLQSLVAGRSIWLAPKVRVMDVVDADRLAEFGGREREYAFRAHFDVVLVNSRTLLPIAAVELDGRRHGTDGVTQARDRLKEGVCQKAGLPLIRVPWGDWGALEALRPMLPAD